MGGNCHGISMKRESAEKGSCLFQTKLPLKSEGFEKIRQSQKAISFSFFALFLLPILLSTLCSVANFVVVDLLLKFYHVLILSNTTYWPFFNLCQSKVS